MQSDPTKSTGFVIQLLKNEPELPYEFGPLEGVKGNYNGLSIFLYRSKVKDPWKWVILFASTLPSIERYNTSEQGAY